MSKVKGNFQSMGLDQNLLKGLNRMGYQLPTPVQRKALPIALAGIDIVCMSRTGSGKTCAFVLPLVQKLKSHTSGTGVRAVILSPTRELAMQTFKVTKDMAKFTDLVIAPIVGGDSIEGQFDLLATCPDIIIATPGRLMHHLREISTFKLKYVKYLVFDEADRLFEMGFAEQLNEIVRECPAERQTLLFSATMPKQLVQFSRAGLRDPQFIRLETEVSLSEELRLTFLTVRSNEKLAALLYLVRTIIPKDHFSIIFTATKHHSELLHALFEKIDVSSTLVYGSMDQDSRTANLRAFRNGEVNYLIVTDVAARGIDIPLINNVINYHFPCSPKLFIHRCGRAARQGRIGFAFSLVEQEECAYMVDVHSFLDISLAESMTYSGDLIYTLENMTPKMVHTGLLPQDALDEENEFLRQCLNDDYAFMKAYQTAENGMIQYKKTRPEATKDGVKGAKKIAKQDLVKTVHPLIKGMDPNKCHDLLAKKQDYVRLLQTFRPAQTVLETGIGTGSRTSNTPTSSTSTMKTSLGAKQTFTVEVMKAFRKVTAGALERNKTKSANIPTETNENTVENDDFLDNRSVDDFIDNSCNFGNLERNGYHTYGTDGDSIVTVPKSDSKPRLSVAERKKFKKLLYTTSQIQDYLEQKHMNNKHISTNLGENDLEKRYKDSNHFMAYGHRDDHQTFMETALQPQSGLRSSEAHTASMMESAMLDITPDTAVDMNKKKKLLRWDAKKRKFVKQTLEEMSAAKKIRSEVGSNSHQRSNKPQGEMYETWKKKRRREITTGTGIPSDSNDVSQRASPQFKFNTNVKKELRDVNEIRKLKQGKEKNRLKNMKRGKRKAVMSKKSDFGGSSSGTFRTSQERRSPARKG